MATRAIDVVRNDFTGTSVTTSAYVQLDSGIAGDTNELEIFCSSSSVLKLATGAAGAEVDIPFYITPGGNDGRVGVGLIPRGTRLSVKAVDATASTGQLVVNLYG